MSAPSLSGASVIDAPYRPDVAPRVADTQPLPRRSSVPFRPDIEGLRAVAVLLVVAYHAGLPLVGGGFVGVDVFFALSGYLITEILVGQLQRTGRTDFVQFYARRVRRLLPAASLMLVATLAAQVLLFAPVERIEMSLSGVATALYSSNLYFLSGATDYFGAGIDGNPLLHAWSLSVEEQFYFVWPVLVFLGFRFTRSRRGLAATLAAVSAVSFALCVWLTHRSQPWAFFGTPARAWEFGIGGLAALGTLPPFLRRWRAPIGWAGVALIAAAGIAVRATGGFPGYVVAVPVVGTVLVLLAGAGVGPTRWSPRAALSLRPLQWLGKRSYSWYLWHWPALSFTLALVPGLSAAGRIACVLGALVVAAVTHALVENPIRFHTWLVARPLVTLAGSIALSLATAGVAWAVHRDASVRGARYWAAAHHVPAMVTAACVSDYTESAPRACTYGDSTARQTVVLFGDSHAIQWFPAMDALARERRWKLVVMTKYSCPVADVPSYNRVLKRMYRECVDWRQAALAKVIALHPAAVVIGQFEHDLPRDRAPDGALRTLTHAEWTAGFRRTLATLDSGGVPTIVLRDTPTIGVVVPLCLARAEHRGRPLSECDAPIAKALDATTYAASTAAAEGLPNVAFVDLTDRICRGDRCEAVRDGIVAYRDKNHISTAMAEHLAPTLGARLTTALETTGRALGQADR